MKYCNKILSVITMILLSAYLISCSHTVRSSFREDKEVIENNINSMLLGNYLRKLMLRVNKILIN